jgi:RNA polymerase sigma-70 factor (ECF subfamily)
VRAAASARSAAHEALAELYHASYRRLVTQLYAFTDDLTEAQDVVAEAFARALTRSRGLADVENPEAWLRTVAINIVRRRWRRRQLLGTILRRDHAGRDLVTAAPSPERADLRDALAALPRAYREVIVLHYFADLPIEQIAAVLGVATGTVKSRLSRGRAALAARLPGYVSEVRDEREERACEPRSAKSKAGPDA